MESRIILSTADFSQNNIGRYVAFSDLTKKVLAKQTKYGMEDAEAIALNTFLANLTDNGYLGGDNPKLTVLMLPCLAQAETSSQLFWNIAALDENNYPKDWSPSVMTDYVQTPKGVYANTALANSSEGEGFKLAETNFFAASSRPEGFSALYYLYDSNMTASNLATRNFLICTSGLSFKMSGLYAEVLKISSPATDYVKATSTSSRVVNNKGFYGMSYIPGVNPSDDTIIVNLNGETGATIDKLGTVETASSVDSLNNNTILLQGNSNNTARPLVSVIAFGHELNATELAALKGYIDTLMAALNI